MLNLPKISVITTTYKRHKELVCCIESVKRQSLPAEHIVVSDGLDEEVEEICAFHNVKCKCLEHLGLQGKSKGHFAKDFGINMATGTYICLWDDDNFYYDDALQNLYNSAKGYDIGICDIAYYKKHRSEQYPDIFFNIPQAWNGEFVIGDIDTMNVCVLSEMAKKVRWQDTEIYEGDHFWLSNLQNQFNASTNYTPVKIGVKL